ncbi:hypothetical protein PC128_g4247 [Phytophthora cactorum]|nr:hypothetical protein PC120_g10404 [Phytophthora cactorum]KAG3200988.1 hypothetical protein PC128_g4247 [Phytophthora cactorum]KAG4054596.1 hypothetical protein PC123_g10312 [Phytophthora cactorum]
MLAQLREDSQRRTVSGESLKNLIISEHAALERGQSRNCWHRTPRRRPFASHKMGAVDKLCFTASKAASASGATTK